MARTEAGRFTPIKLMMFDLKWSVHDRPHPRTGPSAPHDWGGIEPQADFDWQVEFGNNAIFLQAFTCAGYAFHSTRLHPESPWTDLLCARICESLEQHPVGWLLCDQFCYGSLTTDSPVQPAWFGEQPSAQIIGRALPERADGTTPEESLRSKREVLNRQFCRLRDTVRQASPATRIVFSPPTEGPADPL